VRGVYQGFLGATYQIEGKYVYLKRVNIPNGLRIYQIATKYTK
jgi:hypothetical protein